MSERNVYARSGAIVQANRQQTVAIWASPELNTCMTLTDFCQGSQTHPAFLDICREMPGNDEAQFHISRDQFSLPSFAVSHQIAHPCN